MPRSTRSWNRRPIACTWSMVGLRPSTPPGRGWAWAAGGRERSCRGRGRSTRGEVWGDGVVVAAGAGAPARVQPRRSRSLTAAAAPRLGCGAGEQLISLTRPQKLSHSVREIRCDGRLRWQLRGAQHQPLRCVGVCAERDRPLGRDRGRRLLWRPAQLPPDSSCVEPLRGKDALLVASGPGGYSKGVLPDYGHP